METHFTGTIWKLGDDIDTDIIMPTQWLTMDSMDDIKSTLLNRCGLSWPRLFNREILLWPVVILAAAPLGNRLRKP